jgi:hypothetical protein
MRTLARVRRNRADWRRRSGPYVHYPAGPDDLREVMRRLPSGVLDGLQRIDLQLGAEAQLDRADDTCHLAPDPYVGRLGGPFAAGVYQDHILGQYQPRPARIFVYGYVYDPTVEDRELYELVIRGRRLEAFVHEVAHHDDRMRRTGRGRWLADDNKKAEIYAQAGARTWVRDCVRRTCAKRTVTSSSACWRRVRASANRCVPASSLPESRTRVLIFRTGGYLLGRAPSAYLLFVPRGRLAA